MGKLTFYLDCSVSLKSKETLLHFCNFCFTNISLTLSHYINILCLHEKQNEKKPKQTQILLTDSTDYCFQQGLSKKEISI